ncbi:MAG: Hsp20/alpha crystallin family protein [Thermoanaerobaculia bacterium]
MTTSSLTRWNPADLWSSRIHRLFDQAFNDFLSPLTASEEVSDRAWIPAVDVHEADDTLTVTAELPGLRKQDVDITLEDNVLKLSGERRFEKDEKRESYHRIERAYGRFSRSFTLPRNVDRSRVEAQFENGLLKIVLPKSEEARARKIDIA